MFGTAHLGKQWSGQFKRDFHLLRDNAAPVEELLAAVLRHVSYVPNEQERSEALGCLTQMRDFNGSVNILLSCFREAPSLRAFAETVEREFRVLDKYTEAWRSIYGLYAPALRAGSHGLHVVGVTEKSMPVLSARLGPVAASRANTKVGRFLKQVRSERRECYLMELECCFGDLDDAATVKDLWLVAALRSGGATLNMPYCTQGLRVRAWPSFGYLEEIAPIKLNFHDWQPLEAGVPPAQIFAVEHLNEAIYIRNMIRELLSPPPFNYSGIKNEG